MKKTILILVFLVGLFCASYATAGSVSVLNFKAEAVQGKIQGTFDLKSNIGQITDLTYYLTLERESVLNEISDNYSELVSQPIVASYQSKESFSLNQKKSFSFSFDYPESIKSGKYQLSLFVQNKNSSENYGAGLVFVSLSGAGTMVDFDSCVLVTKDGKEYPSFQGPIFDKEEEPTAKCTITNNSGSSLVFTTSFKTNVLHIFSNQNAVQDKTSSLQEYTLLAKEVKNLTFSLPVMQEPNIYETCMQFIEKGTNQIVSPCLILRWTVKGESARIDLVKVAPFKPSYLKGEKISLSLDYSPSPDLWWREVDETLGTDLIGAKFYFTLYDKQGGVCSTAEKNIEALSAEVKDEKFDFIVNEKCKADNLLVQIKKGDKLLDSYTINFPIKEINLNLVFISSLVFLVLVVVIVLLRSRLSKRLFITLLAIIFILYLVIILFSIFDSVLASSGNLPAQTVVVQHGDSNVKNNLCGGVKCSDRNTVFSAEITSYNISDYEQGNSPSIADIQIYYSVDKGLCSNDDAIVFITLKLGNTSKIIEINDKGGSGSEDGIESVNALDNNDFVQEFKNLPTGIGRFQVDGRLVVRGSIKSASKVYYQPVSELSPLAVRRDEHCVISGAGNNEKFEAYSSGWSGYNYCVNCRCGTDEIASHNHRYSPLLFNLPFFIDSPENPPVNPLINQPPIINAGQDKEIFEKQSISLSDATAIDPDNDSLTYSWSCAGDNLVIQDNAVLNPAINSSKTVNSNQIFTCTLVVSDGEESVSDSVDIMVKDTENIVVLSANPSRGERPLNNVFLTANVDGTAYGTISYNFYCKSTDSNPVQSFAGISETSKTTTIPCSYSEDSIAKVVIEREPAETAQDTAGINVLDGPGCLTPPCGPNPQPPTLSLFVDLTANPFFGRAPLNNVLLTASVSGTAQGNIVYNFDCNNDGISDSGDISRNTFNDCDYAVQGNYTAKVNVRRGGQEAEDTAGIKVINLPKWIEIPPTSFLNVLASISNIFK